MTTIEFDEFYKSERNTHLISGKFKVLDVEKVKSFPTYMDIPNDAQELRKWRKVHPVDLYQYSHIVSLRIASKKKSSSILAPHYQFYIRPKDKAILSKLRKGKLVSVKAVFFGLDEKEVLNSRVYHLGVRKMSLR